MGVSIKYYNLKEDKKMNDGMIIPSSCLLSFIEKDGEHIRFDVEINDEFIIFWALESEVSFNKEIEEDWSEDEIKERNNRIHSVFL